MKLVVRPVARRDTNVVVYARNEHVDPKEDCCLGPKEAFVRQKTPARWVDPEQRFAFAWPDEHNAALKNAPAPMHAEESKKEACSAKAVEAHPQSPHRN